MRSTVLRKSDTAKSGYSIRVMWSAEDGEYVATAAEFPSVSWLEPTAAEAKRGLIQLLGSIVEDLKNAGQKVPSPRIRNAVHGHYVAGLKLRNF